MGIPMDQTDAAILIDNMFRCRGYEAILTAFCNRFKYRLIPTSDQIHRLMNAFYGAALVEAKNQEGILDKNLHFLALDNLYRTFAASLYSNITPTPETYSYLIAAGVFGGTEEGIRRSMITAQEMISLSVPFTHTAASAMCMVYLKAGSIDMAVKVLNHSSMEEPLPLHTRLQEINLLISRNSPNEFLQESKNYLKELKESQVTQKENKSTNVSERDLAIKEAIENAFPPSYEIIGKGLEKFKNDLSIESVKELEMNLKDIYNR